MKVLATLIRGTAFGVTLLPFLLGGCSNTPCDQQLAPTLDISCAQGSHSSSVFPPSELSDDTVVVARGGSVAVIDVTSHQIIREIPVGYAPGGAVSLSDGRFTYFPDSGVSKVGVLDDAAEARLDALPVDDSTLSPAGVSTTGGTSALGGQLMYMPMIYPTDGMVGVFDTTIDSIGNPGHGKLLKRIPVDGVPIAITASPSGTRIYVLSTKAGSAAISVIDATVQPVVDQQVFESFALPPGSGWASIAIHSNGEILYVTSADGLSIIDIKAANPTRNTVVGTLALGSQPGAMAFSRRISRDSYLFILNPGSGQLAVVDVKDVSPTRHTIVGSGFSGTARFLAVGDFGGLPDVFIADDTTATQLSPQGSGAGPIQYMPTASVRLPRPASGIGIAFHAGPIPTPDHLYVSLGARGAQQFTLADAEFPEAGPRTPGWFITKVLDNTLGMAATGAASQATSGGNLGAFRKTTHQWTGGNGVALGLEIGHLRSAAKHDPSRGGAIDHLDWSFDDKVISQVGGTPGVATFPLLRQDGYWFNHYDVNTRGSWTPHDYRGLKATDFVNPNAGPVNPDFSTSGGLIEFGYGTANGTATAVPVTTESGIDNWSVTVVLQ